MSDGFLYHHRENVPLRPSASANSKNYAADQLGLQSFDSSDFGIDATNSPKRSIGHVVSDDASPPGSSTTNLARHSASPSLSHKRPCSAGATFDGYDSEVLSNQGIASGESITVASPSSLKGRPQAPRARQRPSGNSISRTAAENGIRKANFGESSNAHLPRFSAEDLRENYRQEFFSRPNSQGTHSSPVSYDSPFAIRSNENRQEKLVARPQQQRESEGGVSYGQKSAGGFSAVAGEEQLINEVRGIYAGLIMVEKKCIEIDKQQSESKNKLSSPQWQALIGLHRTLLQEHHDFFLASQHPLATPVLKRLSEKYAMPARMWRYGIHSFLELLRHRLPDSLEHMLTFIYLAYSMMTLLLESVPAFEDTWIECLGDLARYRMAVEESDLRDREVWAGVARYWYNKAADKNPDVGRIQHHLAVLARPDIVQQLFYYTKSLVSVHSFASTRESIPSLFNPLLNTPRTHHQYPVITAFVAAHGYLFLRTPTSTSTDQFVTLSNEFLSALGVHIGRMGAAFKMQGVYMTSCNFAAILEYGQADAIFIANFKQANQPRSHSDPNAAEKWTPESNIQVVEADFLAYRDSKDTQYMFYGSYLAAQTLSVILDQIGNKNIYPAVHISLAFFWCLALNFTMKHIEAVVPWRKIVTLLNTMIRDDTDPRLFERTEFPFAEETKQIPEDFLIRGQIWSQLYFPPHFFENCLEDEARFIEVPSLNVSRMYRCLWLGVRIASFNRWIKYDSTLRKFSITPFASELERVAQLHNPFRKSKTLQPSLSDFEMRDP